MLFFSGTRLLVRTGLTRVGKIHKHSPEPELLNTASEGTILQQKYHILEYMQRIVFEVVGYRLKVPFVSVVANNHQVHQLTSEVCANYSTVSIVIN